MPDQAVDLSGLEDLSEDHHQFFCGCGIKSFYAGTLQHWESKNTRGDCELLCSMGRI